MNKSNLKTLAWINIIAGVALLLYALWSAFISKQNTNNAIFGIIGVSALTIGISVLGQARKSQL